MQLWNRTEHGRVVADREMVQFFLDSRPVGYSIVGVSEKKKSLRLKSTLMTFTQLYYKKDVRRFDNVGRLNWSQKKYLQPSGWYCRSRSYCTKFALHFKATVRWSNPNIVTFLSSHTFSIVIAIVVRLSMIRISFIRNLLVESYVNYSEVKH